MGFLLASTGLAFFVGPGKKKKWPARAKEWFAWKYPEAAEVHVPECFEELPGDVRSEWQREHEDWEHEHPMSVVQASGVGVEVAAA